VVVHVVPMPHADHFYVSRRILVLVVFGPTA